MNSLKQSLLIGAILVAALALAVPAAFAQGITIDLGKTETGRYMNLVGNTSGSDGEITGNVFIAPEYCATNKGTSMYFAIDDGFFNKLEAGKFVIVNVEYYDAAGVQVKLIYDAIGNPAKEHGQTITTTGSNKWRSQSFIIDDAYFGNGLANSADLKLVAASGTMSINAVSVVPFEAYYNYGAAPDSLYMSWREYNGGDSKTEIRTFEGEECVATTLQDNYLYIAVDDSFIVGGNHPYIFVAVEYYDADPTYSMRLQYDALGATNAHKSSPFVFNKGWNSFRTYTFEISDANFNNRENGGSDLRLQIAKPGMAVNQILIGRLDRKPLPLTNNIENFTAYKALESPVVDGALAEWAWLRPYGVNTRYAGDGSTRIDEFYRTWLLNNANVPVAEAGEPGVSDPGVPGLWDPKDLAGGVSALWDDTNLYFTIIVKDNVVNTAGTAWNNKDGFGFFIDVSHDYKTSGGVEIPVARKDNLTLTQGEHFLFFPANQGQSGTWRHSTAQDGEAMPAGVTKTVVVTDSGYIIEASVPLTLLADGLTWKPGVVGDKDNFNPLFAWMINDNDGIGATSGRLMCGGNSDDDEFWGTLNMNPIPLVDRGITIDLGTKIYESFIKQTELGGDGAVTIVEKNGKTAAQLTAGYLYLDVEDAVINGAKHPHLFVSVEYFDSASTGSRFRVQYDADTAAYVSMPYVYFGNTNTWKTAIFEIKNARFESRQNGRADFRINNSAKDAIINQVRVGVADLWIDLGDSVISYNITETNVGGDGTRAPITVGGINCKRNGKGYPENSRYFYFTVADSLIKDGNHKQLFVTVEYYDTTSSGGIGMNYESMSNTWANAIGDAFPTGTSQWKLHTFYLDDARFNNKENGGSDFRVTGMGEGTTFVNRVMVGSLDPLVTSVDSREAQPFTFALDQNYPNPFNPSTMIGYSIPSSGHVSLKIYNLLGQEVANLVQMDQAAGRHTIRWDASHLSTGVYFCRLIHNNSTMLTNKLMLVK